LDNFVPYLQPGHKIGTVRIKQKTRRKFNLRCDYYLLENAVLFLPEIFTKQRTRAFIVADYSQIGISSFGNLFYIVRTTFVSQQVVVAINGRIMPTK